MFDEDGRKITIQEFPRTLEGLSAEELARYIVELDAEKARVEAEMKTKDAVKNAAESIFKT